MTTLAKHRMIALAGFFGGVLAMVAWEASFDVWLLDTWGVDSTISRAVQAFPPIAVAGMCSLVFLGLGVLIGHFFWPQPPRS